MNMIPHITRSKIEGDVKPSPKGLQFIYDLAESALRESAFTSYTANFRDFTGNPFVNLL